MNDSKCSFCGWRHDEGDWRRTEALLSPVISMPGYGDRRICVYCLNQVRVDTAEADLWSAQTKVTA